MYLRTPISYSFLLLVSASPVLVFFRQAIIEPACQCEIEVWDLAVGLEVEPWDGPHGARMLQAKALDVVSVMTVPADYD